MKAIGDYTIIQIEVNTSSTGLQVKDDGQGKVVSCPSHPELMGKMVLFDDKNKYKEYENYLIIPYKNLMAVIN
tara:strand:- start:43 stop:261 length:219 start_codon:yes stop_codon:yes gene_type:complete